MVLDRLSFSFFLILVSFFLSFILCLTSLFFYPFVSFSFYYSVFNVSLSSLLFLLIYLCLLRSNSVLDVSSFFLSFFLLLYLYLSPSDSVFNVSFLSPFLLPSLCLTLFMVLRSTCNIFSSVSFFFLLPYLCRSS